MKVYILLHCVLASSLLWDSCHCYPDLASTLLAIPKWMSKELKLLTSPAPSAQHEKRLLLKLHGPGFFIRQVPGNRHVARPSKVSIKYASPPPQQLAPYKMMRPYTKFIPESPYKFESTNHQPKIEYVYEKPVYPAQVYQPQAQVYQPQAQVVLPNYDNSPIQTIPAPNLAPHGHSVSPVFESNSHFHHYEPELLPQAQPQIYHQPQHQHQPEYQQHHQTHDHQQFQQHHQPNHGYQVTEDQTNDITVVDPYTGKHKLFAPDPDPHLPVKKLPIESNPLSQPSNGKLQQQLDVVNFNFIHSNDLNSNLQHHHSQQPSLLQNLPSTPYNPTYLVTQSNNLLKNYQQPVVTLFKPEPSHYSHEGAEENSYNVHHVASPGQIYKSQQDQSHQNEEIITGQINSHGIGGGHNILNIKPGSYQYILNDFSNDYPKMESQFEVSHYNNAYDNPHNQHQGYTGNENYQAGGMSNIYVPEAYGHEIRSRSDEVPDDGSFTNHKKAYTEITRIQQSREDANEGTPETKRV